MSIILSEVFKRFLVNPNGHNEDSGQVSFDCPACAEDKGVTGDGKHKLAINYKKGIFKCWVCNYQNNMYGKIISNGYKRGRYFLEDYSLHDKSWDNLLYKNPPFYELESPFVEIKKHPVWKWKKCDNNNHCN